MKNKIIAMTKFNDRKALVLRDKVEFKYEKYVDLLIGMDESNTFVDCLYYDSPVKGFEAFGGHKFDLELTNGETIHCHGQWWSGGSSRAADILGVKLVPVTYNDIESLEECYVYRGSSAIKEKVDQLIEDYKGKLFEYYEFEKAYWNRERVVEKHDGYTSSYSKKVKNPDFVNQKVAVINQ